MGAMEQLRETLFGVSLFHLIRGFSGASGGIRHAKSKATPSHPLVWEGLEFCVGDVVGGL